MSCKRLVHQSSPPNSIKVGSPNFSSSFNQGVLTNLTFQIKSRLVHQPFLPKAYVVVSLVLKKTTCHLHLTIVFQKLHVILTDVVICCVLKENDMSFASYCLFQKLHVILVLQIRSAVDVQQGPLSICNANKYQNKLSNANNILTLIIPQNT